MRRSINKLLRTRGWLLFFLLFPMNLALPQTRTTEPKAVDQSRPAWFTDESTAAFRDQLRAVVLRYRTAMEAELVDDNSYSLERLGTREAIAARRNILNEYRDAYNEWRTIYRNAETTLRRDLERQGVPVEKREAILESYRRGTGASAAKADESGHAADRYVPLMTSFLDFAEAHLGEWRIDAAGRAAFADSALEKRHLELQQQIKALIEEAEARTAETLARMKAAPVLK